MCIGAPGTPTELPGGQTISILAPLRSPGANLDLCGSDARPAIISFRHPGPNAVEVVVTIAFKSRMKRRVTRMWLGELSGSKKARCLYHRLRTENLDLIECGEQLATVPFHRIPQDRVHVVIDSRRSGVIVRVNSELLHPSNQGCAAETHAHCSALCTPYAPLAFG